MPCGCVSPKTENIPAAPPPNGIDNFGHEWKNWLHDIWVNQSDIMTRLILLELGDFDPIGFQTIADVSTATGLTVPDTATKALIQVLGANANWRDDGTSPTKGAGGGFQLAVQDSMLYVSDLSAIEFIEATDTETSRINIVYYI